MTPLLETTSDARRLVYGLLITLAVGLTLGRLASAERLLEPSVHRSEGDSAPRPAWPRSRPDPWPTFSSNDRSRWAVVRALVDHGTFVLGTRDSQVVLASAVAPLASDLPLPALCLALAGYSARTRADAGIIFEDGWQSVDKVLHPSRLEYYSTKPPLLPVLAAAEYWLLKHLLGWSIVEQRWHVIRVILFTLNVLPLALYLALLASMAERLGSTDWARFYVLAAAGFATLVTPFLISFNNHTVATTAVTLALYAIFRIREGGGSAWFLLAGLASGFALCNELPSLALAAGLGVYLLARAPGRTLACFLPAFLLPLLLFLLLNYLALGQWKPAYAEFGTPWYEFEGSHWRVPEGTTKRGIDFAGRNGEPRHLYAFHLLFGHHGWFSLMPIMLLSLLGMALGLLGLPSPSLSSPPPSPSAPPARTTMRLLALFSLLVSLVVFGFYLLRSDNYGGWSNGPRWLMWLTPMWLLCLLPVLDRLALHRLGRGLALLLLVLSMLSMNYQLWNPWRHPWIYNWMDANRWINY